MDVVETTVKYKKKWHTKERRSDLTLYIATCKKYTHFNNNKYEFLTLYNKKIFKKNNFSTFSFQ